MILYSALYDCFHPFDVFNTFDSCRVVDHPRDLKEPGMLIIHGGEDISPTLYHKKKSRRTWAGESPSSRDAAEWALIKEAKTLGIPIMGICRGAQMLCAFAGGFLVQDVSRHAGRHHNVKTKDDHLFPVNSLHHQMMYPFDVEHEMIGWTPAKLSDHYDSEDELIEVPVEPEFVYFPECKGYAVQWHPEMLPANVLSTKYVVNRLEKDFEHSRAN
jgi:putative glutamine amidotransferase